MLLIILLGPFDLLFLKFKEKKNYIKKKIKEKKLVHVV